MTPSRERLLRTGIAAVVAAVASLLVVSSYHPCEGIGPLVILAGIGGAITVAAGIPGFHPRTMLIPAASAVVVIAVAIGLDYSNSGAAANGLDQCEPVPGFAGFLLAGFISSILAGIGALGVIFLASFIHGIIHLQSVRTVREEPGADGNHA